MDVYERMMDTVAQRQLFDADSAVVLMVSGGSDSTALARLAARLRDAGGVTVVTMLHMNHKLRGAAADADAAFVAQLAAELGIPLFSCEMDIAAEARRCGGNIEAVARRERYLAAEEALGSMCQHEGVPLANGRIATAHTADDRIENFYMRAIVGTGPGGFRGMLYRNGAVVRPLLDCTREDLRGYLASEAGGAGASVGGSSSAAEGERASEGSGANEGGQPELWREDATNAHTDRFRAYVRHEMVPRAREWSAASDVALVRTMNLIADEDDMLDAMARDAIARDVEALGEVPEGAASPLEQTCCHDGYLLTPQFGALPLPLARRAIHMLLQSMLGQGERIDAAAVDAVAGCFCDGVPISGRVENIQGDVAVSANKRGVRIEPMAAFRARRKGIR